MNELMNENGISNCIIANNTSEWLLTMQIFNMVMWYQFSCFPSSCDNGFLQTRFITRNHTVDNSIPVTSSVTNRNCWYAVNKAVVLRLADAARYVIRNMDTVSYPQ